MAHGDRCGAAMANDQLQRRALKAAQEFGTLGETAPWDRREEVAREETSENERFRVGSESLCKKF